MKEEEKKPAWYVTDILVPVIVEMLKDVLQRVVEWVWEKVFPEKKNETDSNNS